MQQNVEFFKQKFADQVASEKIRLENAESVISDLQSEITDKVTFMTQTTPLKFNFFS